MTIQTIARKQLDTPTTIHFGRKGTSDCYWFSHGSLKSYQFGELDGRFFSLSIEDVAATDWRVITPSR